MQTFGRENFETWDSWLRPPGRRKGLKDVKYSLRKSLPSTVNVLTMTIETFSISKEKDGHDYLCCRCNNCIKCIVKENNKERIFFPSFSKDEESNTQKLTKKHQAMIWQGLSTTGQSSNNTGRTENIKRTKIEIENTTHTISCRELTPMKDINLQ